MHLSHRYWNEVRLALAGIITYYNIRCFKFIWALHGVTWCNIRYVTLNPTKRISESKIVSNRTYLEPENLPIRIRVHMHGDRDRDRIGYE